MVTINTSEDLIDLLRRDKGFRRDVVKWLGYADPFDLSDNAVQAGDANSLAATLRQIRDDGERHDATLRAIHELTAEVARRTDAFEKRMDDADARHQAFEARMDDADARHREFLKRMDDADARHKAFEARMDAADVRHKAFEARMDQHSTEMRAINERYASMQGRVGNLWGEKLERQLRREYRWVLGNRFGCARVDLIWTTDADNIYRPSEMTERFLDRIYDTSDRGLSDEEYRNLIAADIIARGIMRERSGAEWFVGEASGAVQERDVRRAKSRAGLLSKVMGETARAFAYGYYTTDAVRALAADIGVELVIVAAPDDLPAEAFAESEMAYVAE